MATLFDSGIFSIEGLAGEILPGAKLYFYASGTSTPLTTYADQALSTPNLNPLEAASDGRFGPIWLQNAAYKIVLKTVLDGVMVTRDPIIPSGMPVDNLSASLSSPTGASLVGVSNGETVEDNLIFSRPEVGAVKMPVRAHVIQQWATPENFRDTGDTDLTALNRLAAVIGGTADNGVPLKSARIDRAYTVPSMLTLTNRSDFELRGSGSIKMADSAAIDSTHYVLKLDGCSDALIEGFTVDGNRAGRTPSGDGVHNVWVKSCNNLAFKRISSINSIGDGFYVATSSPTDTATYSRYILFEDCIADNSYRQGMSLIDGEYIFVDRGSYRGTNGTAPQAGIDLESNAGNLDNALRHIYLRGVDLRGNSGVGLQVSAVKKPEHIYAIDCMFTDNDLGAIIWGAISGDIVRPIVDGVPTTITRGAIDFPSNATNGNCRIVDPVFRNVLAGSTKALIYVHSSSAGNVEVSGLDVDAYSCAIAQMIGPNCRFIRSKRIGTSTHTGIAISMGDDALAENVVASGFASTFLAMAARAVARGIRLSEPTSNDNGGVVRFTTAGARIEDILITRAASAAGYGIVAQGAPSFMTGCNVDGFTGNPYLITGTSKVQRGNLANGALLTGETALA